MAEAIHLATLTRASISSLHFPVVQHPPYRLDLAPNDFHLFGHLKKGFKGIRFTSDAKSQRAVSSRLRAQPQEFYENGIRKLIKHWLYCSQQRLC